MATRRILPNVEPALHKKCRVVTSFDDRLHTLLPGMAILSAVIERYGCEHFVASPYGVREGYLLEKLEETGHGG